MHIISPPPRLPPPTLFSIPLLHRFAGKHGRSPHVLCPAFRSARLPGGGLSHWQEGGGGVRVHQPAWEKLPLGAGGGKAPLRVGLSHGCGRWSVLYGACGVRLLCFSPRSPLSQTSPGNKTVKTSF